MSFAGNPREHRTMGSNGSPWTSWGHRSSRKHWAHWSRRIPRRLNSLTLSYYFFESMKTVLDVRYSFHIIPIYHLLAQGKDGLPGFTGSQGVKGDKVCS